MESLNNLTYNKTYQLQASENSKNLFNQLYEEKLTFGVMGPEKTLEVIQWAFKEFNQTQAFQTKHDLNIFF